MRYKLIDKIQQIGYTNITGEEAYHIARLAGNLRNWKTLQLSGIIIGITIAVWVLRGFGILGFMPGGVIWLLVLMAIATGIFGIWQQRWSRF